MAIEINRKDRKEMRVMLVVFLCSCMCVFGKVNVHAGPKRAQKTQKQDYRCIACPQYAITVNETIHAGCDRLWFQTYCDNVLMEVKKILEAPEIDGGLIEDLLVKLNRDKNIYGAHGQNALPEILQERIDEIAQNTCVCIYQLYIEKLYERKRCMGNMVNQGVPCYCGTGGYQVMRRDHALDATDSWGGFIDPDFYACEFCETTEDQK